MFDLSKEIMSTEQYITLRNNEDVDEKSHSKSKTCLGILITTSLENKMGFLHIKEIVLKSNKNRRSLFPSSRQ